MIFFFLMAFVLFVLLLFQHTYLSIIGMNYKLKVIGNAIDEYPSVDVFIPAYNEGVVMRDTLEAMVHLNYPGRLMIYVLNDGSKDETGEIAASFEKMYKNVFHIQVPDGQPKGKSRVLNYGLSISSGEYFVVFDGDNQPEPDAVKYLMEGVVGKEGAVGAVGTIRTLNARKNILTRMIAIEFQVFQLILQVGRWGANQIGSLPGTNMLLRRTTIEKLGGYDEHALAEDAELTIRIAAGNQYIVVEPRAVTWEQEPERLRALLRQRTRWVQGNIYLMFKFFRTPSWWTRKCMHHLFYYISIYVLFPLVLLVSNTLFILGILDIFHIPLPIPFVIIWFMAYFLYTMQLILAQWYDGTLEFFNVMISFIMYFTYAQLFIFLLFKGFLSFFHAKCSKKTEWVKTERVQIQRK